jgi:signal transduction histidine kinase/ligand-binding sensor domain-containing protein
MAARQAISNILHLVLLLLIYCPSLQASPSEIIGFRRLSVDQGLSQSTVNCVTQDRDGFLWFGTQDGLNKYDGYTFEIFRKVPGDTSSLSDNYITSLLADTHGNIWIGTYSGGVNWLDPHLGIIRRYPLRVDSVLFRGSRSVMAIAEDSSGNIWVATWGGGLDRLDPRRGGWTHCKHEHGHDSASAGERATSIVVDRQGHLWLGTWDGLHQYDPVTGCLRYSMHDSPLLTEDKKIMSVYSGSDGMIWYGTFAAGLFRYDPRSLSLARYTMDGREASRLSGMSVRSILQDRDGRLWIGTWGGGIDLLDPVTNTIRNLPVGPYPSLSINQVFALCEDRSGGIWVGLEGAGVNQYDPTRFKFRHIRYEPGSQSTLSNPVVRALCEDRSGYIWIGAEGGSLDQLNPATGQVVQASSAGSKHKAIGVKTVLALLEDTDGYLWAGTDGEGLHRLDPTRKKWERIPLQRLKDEMVGPDHVIWLCEAKDGVLWVGTLGGGLIKMNRRTLAHQRYIRTSRTASGQLSGNYVYCLLEDRDGKLWIGTWGAGISILDPRTDTFVTYQHDEANPHSLAQNSILAFHEDRGGTIWVATLGGGLDYFDPTKNSFNHITESNGLPNNVINGILEDSTGTLWLSTNRGICRFHPEARTFRNYDIGDGLQSMEFNQGAFCKGRDGTLYFGGINGVNSCSPADVPADTLPPAVRITRCTVFDHPMPVPPGSQSLNLSYDQNFVSFEFTALDYTAPEKNAYRYMMEGLDRDWVSSGSRRYASYANLPSGDYVFHVRGSNSDGLWNLNGASLHIHVVPPYWERAWFRVLALVLILGTIFLLFRRRINQLERERQLQSSFSRKLNESQETERKRVAGELHDGLGQELLTIKNALTRVATTEAPAVRTRLADIESSVHRAIEEVRQISADLHPHMLERLGLTRTIESMVRRIAQAACLQVISNIDPIDGLLRPNEEINLYRILQEALTNVVKHSDASQCTVRVERTGSQIKLAVYDDGRGFEPAAAATSDKSGLGLVNMAERVRMLHGDMEIRSAPGSGTTLSFHFPLSGRSPGNTNQDFIRPKT